MAQLLFSIANGKLTTSGGGRTEQFYASDYRAKSWRNGDADGVIVFPILGSDEPYSKGTFTYKDFHDVALKLGDGLPYSPASVDDFVTVFNAIAGVSIGFNTKYPESLFSQYIELDTSIAEQVVPLWAITGQNAGYVILTASDANTGSVYVGESDVDANSYHLEVGKSITLEISDLSLIWVLGEDPGDTVSAIGCAKT
jgi:hypothetical protein